MGNRRQHNAEYSNLKMREHYRGRKEQAVEYKGGQCEICGYNKCLSALEFHHRDPDQKDFSVSGPRRSWEKTSKELDKCSLLCSNCHREEHERLTDVKHYELKIKVRYLIPEIKRSKKIELKCKHCGEFFKGYSNRKFCGRSCKAKNQYNTTWPSDDVLAEWAKNHGLRFIAEKIGVHAKSVRYQLTKKNIMWVRYRR